MARPLTHLIASAGLGAVLWIRTGRLAPAVAPLVSGFLIDGDHLVDFARYRANGKQNARRVLLPLHGWEYVPLLFLLERLIGWRLAGGLAAGYLTHLAIDQSTNTIRHPLAYSLIFRGSRGFASTIFNHRDESEIEWIQQPVTRLWRFF